ncbi:hypothetical protein QBC37DRAFT_376786 [Rhypophila decipiens]|uniref:Peptidase C1A papain C-terminal domain-containing protein n=1 Tax=Rhypophila decipiens TaxID=261697 RepID=A0AAN7B4K8_9PEZI|nr:hypothetical protein QBC37DRAFT_376786 [Rhypophila decipiens]
MGQETSKSVKIDIQRIIGASKPILITIEGTPSNQLQTSTCYAHALAPAIYMALKTRRIDDLNLQTADRLPSIDEIRGMIICLFPYPSSWRDYSQLWRTVTKLYPHLDWHEIRLSQHMPYKTLMQGRPVYVGLTLSRGDGLFLGRFFRHNLWSILTRLKYHWYRMQPKYVHEPQPGDKKWCHAVLWTGWDPGIGVCPFLNSWGPNWGNNGSFQVEDIDLLREMPGAELRFFDVYCPEPKGNIDEPKKHGSKLKENLDKWRRANGRTSKSA